MVSPAEELESQLPYEFLRPLTAAWIEVIDHARKKRRGFDGVAQQCTAFFQGGAGFMWDAEFRSKFMGNCGRPRFFVTIQKAFELVALFGPTLYWQNPAQRRRQSG